MLTGLTNRKRDEGWCLNVWWSKEAPCQDTISENIWPNQTWFMNNLVKLWNIFADNKIISKFWLTWAGLDCDDWRKLRIMKDWKNHVRVGRYILNQWEVAVLRLLTNRNAWFTEDTSVDPWLSWLQDWLDFQVFNLIFVFYFHFVHCLTAWL